jgi:hypothetical protein
MTLTVILVVLGALALLLIIGLPVFGNSQADPGSDQIEPIDLEAFRNLVDPGEAEYLRRCLPVSEFRRVQRERLLAVAAYVRVATRNATVLIGIGQNALTASDPSTAAAARQLIESALLLRRNSALILIRIYLEFVWPKSGLAATPIVSAYEKLSGTAMLLGRLQNPASPIRISVS